MVIPLRIFNYNTKPQTNNLNSLRLAVLDQFVSYVSLHVKGSCLQALIPIS